MKINPKKVLSLVLSVAMLFSLAMPAFAAGENNTEGITFSAKLDQSSLTVSEETQTVKMTISASAPVSLYTMMMDIACEGLTLTSVENATLGMTSAHYNTDTGKISWFSAADDIQVTDLLVATFTVPANTPAGTYTISAENFELANGYGGNIWETGASVSTTLTINGNSVTPPSNDPYTAAISTDKTSYVVGDTVTATITVGGTVGSFASAQAKLTYDSDYLSFVPTAQSEDIASVTVNDGTITIIDNGETQADNKFALTFTAQADVDATKITLTEAAFDVAANAPIENLQEATLTTTEATIAISPADLTVDLADLFTGNTSVVYDGTYTFTAVDPNYEYDIVVNEGAYTAVYDEETGKWTISNVRDNLTITATRTAKKVDVTITEMDAIDTTNGIPATGEDAATYKVDYVFTLKADTESQPGIAGYKYSVTSITIGGQEVSNSWSNSGLVYTIDGDYITDNIVITTDVEEIPAGDFSVEIEEGVGDELTVDKNSVEPGGTVTLTWTPVTGYDYTIEINGVEVPEDGWTPVTDDEGNPTGEYTYTIEDVQEAIIVTVEKNLDLTNANVSVASYLSLNGKTIYLVQVSTKLDSGNVYTYGGQNMYWSEKYNAGNGANAFLVIMDNQDAEGNNQILTVETAIPQINITQGSATTINYGGDVNMAAGNIVDANDAQLVYNMYQTKSYDAFTDSVTMEKFLRADVNGNATVETEDVTAIISIILAQ